ncbi:DNA primase [Chlamydia ibidis]|uniref:DNA primase n=2 Tax=Chlamydia ibidis TaxID=1405396 RepID=S7J3U3_9CHLA|nr:DNA primase [Chlamydia ibidis]EPP34893.1 DNA primase [Chlamydia ibidis]EQM62514.1 DNA primase [Chlamydia ibidis 10-1398/6]
MYTEESLDLLRHSIDIVDVLSEHLHLKRGGATYKACCPFHMEKTPSFIVNPTGGYYHCFGCGAHGDAISFLMHHLGFSFIEAVLSLSKRFHVNLVLQEVDKRSSSSSDIKRDLRNINAEAENFFRYCLYHLHAGREALYYLYRRGFSPDTIDRFHLGYAPEHSLFVQAMQEKGFSEENLRRAGFFGNRWFLFAKRITFPIHDGLGHTIGFSSRKFLPTAHGSKYVNTPETPLFKKSRVLFGLNFSRRRITKEKRAILVEGQADCLQMIDYGFNCTVSAQGTAFTEEHVRELTRLGVSKIYLLFDSDEAGTKAALKVGDMCQSDGIAVMVCRLPKGHDPDSFLIANGSIALSDLLDQSDTYLSFLVAEEVRRYPNLTPVEKALIVKRIVGRVDKWKNPIVVYEHLKQLASLMMIPENMVFALVDSQRNINTSDARIAKSKEVTYAADPDLVIETDVLRCMLFSKVIGESILFTAREYFTDKDFKYAECKELFIQMIKYHKEKGVLIPFDTALAHIRDSVIISLLTDRRINTEKLDSIFLQAAQKLVDRRWREECHSIIHRSHGADQLAVLEAYARHYKEKITVSLISFDSKS